MILFGAGGHAKVIASSLRAGGIPLLAVFDDDPRKTDLLGFPIDGAYNPHRLPTERIILGLGLNKTRMQVAGRIRHPFGTVVHPSSEVDESASFGLGSVILHRTVLQAGTSLGRHVIVNTGAVIDHDCRVDDFAHIAPQATLCGGVGVGEGALVGAGAVILPGVTLGRWVVVGAGAVVIEPVPDFAWAVGNPARVIKRNAP